MPDANASKDTGKGTGEPGWTEQEKGQDASGLPGTTQDADAGEAGDAQAKGRPTDERQQTESAAARTER
ncbi:MAG TPA: hypothetical protein VGC80_08595 [Acetobacteraceae bacterium]|jgi:hypothetical protein